MRDGRIVSDQPTHRVAGEAEPVGLIPVRDAIARASSASGTLWSTGFARMIVAAAAQAIWRNRLRSTLTMLGVFIGVAALIAMVAVGQGANAAVKRQIESLGTNLLVVLPGTVTANGVRAGSGSASTLTVSDAMAIRREDDAVGRVAYLIRQVGQIQYGDKNWSTGIQGVSADYPFVANWQIASGRAFKAGEQESAAMVALLGATVRHQLFNDVENPVGAMILVKGVPVRVVGLLAAKGQTSYGQDQDDVGGRGSRALGRGPAPGEEEHDGDGDGGPGHRWTPPADGWLGFAPDGNAPAASGLRAGSRGRGRPGSSAEGGPCGKIAMPPHPDAAGRRVLVGFRVLRAARGDGRRSPGGPARTESRYRRMA